MTGLLELSTTVALLAGSFLAASWGRLLWRRGTPSKPARQDDSIRKMGHPITLAAALTEASREGKRKVDMSNLVDDTDEVPSGEQVDVGFGFRASYTPEFAKSEED